MSAPALAPRPAARPAARPAPGRPASGRTTPARGSTSRATTARGTSGAGPAAGRGPTGRGATTRGATTRGTTATVGATALRAPAARPALQADPRPRMRVVERPELAPRRIGFALTCTALLGSLMLGLLLLNVAISGNAFTLAELQSERGLLVDRQQALEQQLLVESAPSSLADKARGLGMVPAPEVIVLAPDGSGAPPLVEDD